MQRWKCLEAERGVTRGDFKMDTGIFRPLPEKRLLCLKDVLLSLIDMPSLFLEGISFGIIILEFQCLLSNFYVVYICASHFQPLEKVQASRRTGIDWDGESLPHHRPPTTNRPAESHPWLLFRGQKRHPSHQGLHKSVCRHVKPSRRCLTGNQKRGWQKTEHHGWFMKNRWLHILPCIIWWIPILTTGASRLPQEGGGVRQ